MTSYKESGLLKHLLPFGTVQLQKQECGGEHVRPMYRVSVHYDLHEVKARCSGIDPSTRWSCAGIRVWSCRNPQLPWPHTCNKIPMLISPFIIKWSLIKMKRLNSTPNSDSASGVCHTGSQHVYRYFVSLHWGRLLVWELGPAGFPRTAALRASDWLSTLGRAVVRVTPDLYSFVEHEYFACISPRQDSTSSDTLNGDGFVVVPFLFGRHIDWQWQSQPLHVYLCMYHFNSVDDMRSELRVELLQNVSVGEAGSTSRVQ